MAIEDELRQASDETLAEWLRNKPPYTLDDEMLAEALARILERVSGKKSAAALEAALRVMAETARVLRASMPPEHQAARPDLLQRFYADFHAAQKVLKEYGTEPTPDQPEYWLEKIKEGGA